MLGTVIRDPRHDHQMTEQRADGVPAVGELTTTTLADLERADVGTPEQQVAQDAMVDQLRSEVDYQDSRLAEQLKVIATGVHGVREIFDLMPTDTTQHWATIAQRLSK